ncbi:MAG: DUF4249 domain-containing protein [Bacteroidetes bacterium]|nr:MAG: DUF4249 domain-containing protein [Bacteroidota bacterium]
MNSNTIKNMSGKFKLITTLFLPLGIFLLAGCEKTVDNIKLPTTAPKLVVGCFISPQDSWITVTLTRSNPIFGPGHNNTNTLPVEDASVIISDGTNTASIPFNSLSQQYEMQTSTFPIISGQTYSLTVSTPTGENVSANCTVPASIISALTVDFTDTASNLKKTTVKWQDIPNEINYYRVVGQIVSIYTPSPGDTIFNDMYSISNATAYNDHEKDGNELYAKLEGSYYEGSEYSLVAYDFYLLHIDGEYYNYQNSLDHYTYGDPFSEPIPLYTNIRGGLGVFAAYQKLYVRLP